MSQDAYASGRKVKRNAVQEYASDPNAKELRVVGMYNDYEENDPWSYARNIARGELALSIEAIVTSTIHTIRHSDQQREGKHEQKSSSRSADLDVKTVSQQLISGARVAKEEAFKQKDGTITVYVCMEIDKERLLENIQNNRQLQNIVDDDDKQVRYDFSSDESREAFETSYENNKNLKSNHDE